MKESSKSPLLWMTLAAFVLAVLGTWALLDSKASNDEVAGPAIVVQEVLIELVDEPERWQVAQQRPEAAPSKGVFSPFVDLRFTGSRYDTGDKPALIMPPPCEVEIEILESDGACQLRSSAQISSMYTDRGIEEIERYRRESGLDRLGLEKITVRFEVLLNGAPVFDETITHAHGQVDKDREWSKVGDQGLLNLEPGDRVTFRTTLPVDEQAAALGSNSVVCGFGGLTLEASHRVKRRKPSRESPSLLFVVMDTLRADRMSCYGYDKQTTPNLDGLAERGILFENAYATSSWTWPSTASLHTGLLPYEHGVLANGSGTLVHARETVAEVLQMRGYTTQAFSSNPLIDETRLFNQGFESFDSVRAMRMTDGVIDSIESALDDLADKRFFLYLHLVDPHTPHTPLPSELERLGGVAPEDYPDRKIAGVSVDGSDHYAGELSQEASKGLEGAQVVERVMPAAHQQWLHDRYDASVGTGDVYMGRILDKLSQLGLDETTIVVFTADHGEELLDHHRLAHGHSLWPELTHVPLIIAGPEIPQGKRIPDVISNRHVGPTLARLGGTELKACQDSPFLLDLAFPAQAVFTQTSKGVWNGHTHQELLGLRTGDWALQYASKGGPFGTVNPEGDARLFDLKADPDLKNDLLRDTPNHPQFASMLQALKQSQQGQLERRTSAATGVGEAGWKALQNIGYAGQDEELDK